MQFHYNAAHTGDYSPVAGSTPSNGKFKWSYTTASRLYTSPAVANGLVYVGSVAPDGKVYALDANSGIEKWHYTTGDSTSA